MFDPADDGSQPLAERISRAFLATQELLTIQLGRQLGLYETLAADAAMTAGTLAARSGCDERYLREWLEQQAVAGFLDVDDCCADPAERRYRLEGEARAALLDTSGVDYVAPLAGVATALARCLPQVQNAFSRRRRCRPAHVRPRSR